MYLLSVYVQQNSDSVKEKQFKVSISCAAVLT